jgi:glucose-6-phosphate isomerase
MVRESTVAIVMEPIVTRAGVIVLSALGTMHNMHFQLLHRGTGSACDFIALKKSLYGENDHQNKLLANCF